MFIKRHGHAGGEGEGAEMGGGSMRDGQAGRAKGRWRRKRWRKLRENMGLNRKERKVESSPDPEKTETKKRGLKGARGWERSKKPSLSWLRETLSGSD